MRSKPNLDIQNSVDVFLEAILPDNASQIQINETKKAFIAGMFQARNDILKISSFEEKMAENALNKYCKELDTAIRKLI